MKNLKKYKLAYLTSVLITTLGVTSCQDSLDIEPTNVTTVEQTLSSPELAERLLFTTYNSTESWAIERSIWWGRRYNIENASFESKFNFKDQDRLRVRGGWNSTNAGDFRNKWTNYWVFVRQANDFIEKINGSEAMASNPAKVNVLLAEMKFLRANIYRKLINYYGGVPIIEKALGLADDFEIKRNSYQECVAFIVKELDEAIAVLPDSRPAEEFGRATKLSAMAVKSRTLLYAASSLHNPSTSPSGPLYDYDVATKWQDAADAAKDIIDAVGNRELISVADAKEYQELFLTPNDDILFARPYSEALYEFGTDANSLPDQTQSPSGYGGWALSSPTHNFTLQFNFADGTSTNGVTPTDPNADREMRYYADLNFNGANFRGREVEYFVSDHPDADNLGKNDTGRHGFDSPSFDGPGNELHSSRTGYNIRKFQDEKIGKPDSENPYFISGLTEISASRPYILFRLAEVYLNYAEAQYNLGNEAEALTYINKVSRRALQPDITASGSDLLEAIKRERRVELCFEGHNFYDERRWMNEDHLGFDIKGLSWRKAVDGTLSFTENTVVSRPWDAKMYYLPIPLAEIQKVSSLEQNSGY